ncbi:ABC transporter ATP-binding protein [Candidatus Fermentibacteria bacterium]|nr:ABC transporter ATP-binding protein [Candidatus Fermentibacteria bacterium]
MRQSFHPAPQLSREVTLDPVVELRGITKSFGPVKANDHIDLDLWPGEIHALLGANGAGKSTLMSILAGSYSMDAGTIRVRGRSTCFRSPADALKAGIGMVYQHSMLLSRMTVAENMAVGDRSMPRIVRRRELLARASAMAERLGFPLDPQRRVAELSVAERQQADILRNLAREVVVLILDEPTAVLTPQETAGLFATMRTLIRDGASVVFISHRLDEVLHLADRITVLRQGRVVHSAPAVACAPGDLVAHMMGSPAARSEYSSPAPAPGRVVLKLQHVQADGLHGVQSLTDVSLEVRAGEILGVAGVAGAGQSALAEVLAGLRAPSAGSILVDGDDMTGMSAHRFRMRGVRYVPGDRRGRGVAQDLSLAENAALTWLHHPRLGRGHWLSRGAVWRMGADLARSEGIEPGDPGRLVRLLSGGTIQKLIVGRETLQCPVMLIAEYPLHGLDVQATGFVEARLRALASSGTAIVLISEDFDQLLSLSQRIVVLFRGRIVAQRRPEATTPLQLGLDMLGPRSTP